MTEAELRSYASSHATHPVLAAHSAASLTYWTGSAIVGDATAISHYSGRDFVEDALSAADALPAVDGIAFGWVTREGTAGYGYGSEASLCVFPTRTNPELKPGGVEVLDGARSALGKATAILAWPLEPADLGTDWIAPDLAAGVAAVV